MVLLTTVLEILKAYLELKNKSYAYDILQNSRKEQDRLQELIDKAVTTGSDCVDIVLRLQREQKLYEDISNTYFKTSSGSGS
jgi:hypothetical protein